MRFLVLLSPFMLSVFNSLFYFLFFCLHTLFVFSFISLFGLSSSYLLSVRLLFLRMRVKTLHKLIHYIRVSELSLLLISPLLSDSTRIIFCLLLRGFNLPGWGILLLYLVSLRRFFIVLFVCRRMIRWFLLTNCLGSNWWRVLLLGSSFRPSLLRVNGYRWVGVAWISPWASSIHVFIGVTWITSFKMYAESFTLPGLDRWVVVWKSSWNPKSGLAIVRCHATT